MMNGVAVYVCAECGHAVFPARLICSRCGSTNWREVPVDRGIVLATTAARKRVIVHKLIENRIAEVQTRAGPIVIVRLLGEAEPGTEVALGVRAGGIFAQPIVVEGSAQESRGGGIPA